MTKKPTLKEIEQEIVGLEPSQALEYLYIIKDRCTLNITRLIEKYTKRLKAFEEEKRRFDEMCIFEREAYSNGIKYIAGIDEAGRGPLAGPVVSAAVILPQDVFIENLKDSKKLTPAQRERLFDEIKKKAIAYGIGIVDEKCIDKINILNATKLAMKKAVKDLVPVPDILFIDAVYLDNINIKQKVIEKGDNLSISIAAASILAKVTRDKIIEEMDLIYPLYGFAKNKGYGTKEHIDAIKKYGICPIHRISFVEKFIKG
ncbi:MAG: ribonuclease HII [Firmicutes bacterium]|nr:ribonuclease HII [Bacillota bacterium]